MYTMNHIERHLPMATRVRSGMFVMCMTMAPPERGECVPASSGANPSLAAPTHLHSNLRKVIMMEAMTDRIP